MKKIIIGFILVLILLISVYTFINDKSIWIDDIKPALDAPSF